MAVLSNGFEFVGTDVPLRLRKGQIVQITVQITDDDGNILDITGRDYAGLVGAGGGAVHAYSFGYIIDDGPNGLVTLSWDTAAVAPGDYRMEVWENNYTNFLWGGPVEVLARDVI